MRRILIRNIVKLYQPAFCLVLGLMLQFAVSSDSIAQSWTLAVDGKVFGGGDKLSGAIVTLFKNNAQQQQIVTTSNGRFSFDLPANAEYIVSITKPGYITKKFKINTANVPADRGEAGGFNIFEPDVTLFEMPTAPEISKRVEAILSQPIAVYQYIPGETNFGYDQKYTDAIQSKLAELAQLQKQVEKEMEDKAKNAAVEAQKQLEIDKKYKAAIAKGDGAMASKDYASAKSAYSEALGVKPGEAYPKTKLSEIDKLMAESGKEKETEAKYQAAVKKGDGAFGNKDYAGAKAAFTEASGIKPAEAYPKTKLAEIDKLLADAGKQKELDAKYQAAITKGDVAFGSKDYTSAKAAFTEASGVKPTEAYPKTKIAEIDKLLADVGKQKELDAKYQVAISKGDGSFGSKDYAGAKTAFTEASGIKPTEAYPKTKLAEIDKLLADAGKQKELDAKYQAAITKGDGAFGSKDYAGARAAFTEASGIKPAEAYPKTKLGEIDKLLGAAEAEKQKELQYKNAIAKADAAFTSKDYSGARSSYTEASGIKPTEAYPKTKLAEIDKMLGAAEAEKQKTLQYNNAIAKADAAFAAKDYTGAKTSYSEASAVKPAEAYPKTKIAECDKLLAEIAKQRSGAEKEQQYKDAITRGDKLFASKEYDNSKAAYTEALGVKPAEQYPKSKIAEIDNLLAAAGKENAVNAQYKAAIERGDNGMSTKDYAAAKAGYTEALGVKPGEAYPKNKLAEIERLMASASNASLQGDADAKYKATIAKGDKAFFLKDYVTAKPMYTEASRIKPSEEYPKGRLAEIADIEKNMAAAKEQKELEAQYKEAIGRGDRSFAQKDYNSAKLGYQDALTYKPDEKYPTDRIKLIEELIRKQNAPPPPKKEPKKVVEVVPVVSEADKIKMYQDELRAKYPIGVTEEEFVNNGKTILRRVVIKADYAGVYTKVTHNWGGVYCFRDNVPVTEIVFENESK